MTRFKLRHSLLLCLLAVLLIHANLLPTGADQHALPVAMYASLSDIPDVTDDEIRAIDALRAKYDFFVYGAVLSTETFAGSDGVIRGFTALLCQYLSDIIGIRFEPALYEWDELLRGLDKGLIDFTGELTATSEIHNNVARSGDKTFFMTDAITERAIKYMRLEGSPSFADILDYRPPRYMFIKGTTTEREIRTHSNDVFMPIYADNYTQAYGLLKSGRADALFDSGSGEAAFVQHSDIVARSYFPLILNPVSFATSKLELRPVISVIQKMLNREGRRYISNLYNIGEDEYAKNKLTAILTDEEIAYIRDNPEVIYAAEEENYPISFYNAHDQQWQGIAIDVLKKIESLSGLRFVRHKDTETDYVNLLNKLERNEISLVTDLIRTTDLEDRFIWPGNAILADYYTLISKAELENIRINEIIYMKVGVARNTAYESVFTSWFPDHQNTIQYDTVGLAFEALRNGEVVLVMACQKQLLMLTNYMEYVGYKANVVFDYPYFSTFGFNRDEPILCSIVDKALRVINTQEIASRWTQKVFDYSTMLARAQLPWLIGGLVMTAGVLVLIAIMLNRKRIQGKTLEKLVQKRTVELEAVVNNYKGVIWSVDKEGYITIFKGRYLDTIGVTPAFLEGKKLSVAKYKNRHLDIIDNVEKTFLEGPQDWIGEIDNGVFHSYTTLMHDDAGKIIGVVGSTDDVTESIRLQQELESASRAKSTFLANMSHEIRTPMNAIIGMTSIAESSDEIERKDYAIGKIRDASNHLLGVINDILDISKIESGKFELSPVEFSFEEMLHRVTSVSKFRIDDKQQMFSIYIDQKIPHTLLGDEQRLAQVITNLLSNAVKFTSDHGFISVNARLVDETNDICTIEIAVTDSGIGISKEQQERLFQAFVQAESSTTRKYGGTGLGLVISKNIVEMMGGQIRIDSDLGRGAMFVFTVKMRHMADKPKTIPNWENVRVMAVDDDLMTLEYFSEVIGKHNALCDTASNAIDALMLERENGPYNVYFIDVNMPGMKGPELAHALTEKTADPQKYCIALMSGAEIVDTDGFIQKAGVRKKLIKPLFPSDIVNTVNEFLGIQWKPDVKQTRSNETFEGRRILLAEDVEINREIVLTLLEPSLIRIDCAENGREALEKFSKEPGAYDLIFMDMQMPEMDGLEATRQIRALPVPEAATIPIVAMTANVFREDVEKSMEAGMNGHIGKPLDLDEVWDILRIYLK